VPPDAIFDDVEPFEKLILSKLYFTECAFGLFVEKLEEKRSVGIPRRRWRIILKLVVKK
jgi:hypothetical protein